MKKEAKTLIWTKIQHKHPQQKLCENGPQKVDKLMTFEVAKLITLERPKDGQTNNSPAYIYILSCAMVRF